MNVTVYLLKSTIVGALGGLLFGFDTAVIAGTTHQLTSAFGLSTVSLGITVSVALWGTVVGCLFAGILGQKVGGREALRWMACLYIVSAIGCAVAWNWPALITFRFIGGLGIGGSSVLGPVYIAELAPAKWRGRLGGPLPDQHCGRNSPCLSFQFPYRTFESRSCGVALGTWCCSNSRHPVPHHALRYPAQFALARHTKPNVRSARSAANDGLP